MEKSYLHQDMNMIDIMSRRRTTVMYSQSNLQPLTQGIQAGYLQNIFIQPSRQFMNLGQQKLLFRPVIQMGTDTLPDLCRKQMMGITSIDSASYWTCQSITFGGNQIKSQAQSQQQRTASLFMAYYNAMTTKKPKHHLTGSQASLCSQSFSSSNGSTIQGFQQNIPTHPITNSTGAVNTIGSLTSAPFEGMDYAKLPQNGVVSSSGFYYPRAIINRQKIVNADFNWCPDPSSAGWTAGLSGNSYFGGTVSLAGDCNEPNVFPQASPLVFPLLPKSTTPSICLYLAQQSNYEAFRLRFLTQIVSAFSTPWMAYTAAGANLGGINQNISLSNNFNISGTGTSVTPLELSEQYCMSVQNGDLAYKNFSTYTAGTTIQSNSQRQLGSLSGAWQTNTASPVYVPPELYTQLEVSLGELSMELDMLGEISLELAGQIQIQLQLNLPQNVLSAFLQPSLFAFGNGANGSAMTNANGLGASSEQCKTFLNACTLGSATYVVNDMCMRLTYLDYPSESYEYVKSHHKIPKPYFSLRGPQIDPIPLSQSSTFTQRLAITNPIIIGFVTFFVPTNNNKPTYIPMSGQITIPTPSDTLVNYYGANPITDARQCYMDSYYITMTDFYIDTGDGRRFNANQIPIANPALCNYLQSMDGLETMLKRYLPIEFREWTANRFVQFTPFNLDGSPELALTSSQVVITMVLDSTSRVESSNLYGECNNSLANQFSAVTFAITNQALCDGSFVRVA